MNREMSREMSRKTNREMDSKMLKHGSVSTYKNDGCRCRACKAAHASAMRRYYKVQQWTEPLVVHVPDASTALLDVVVTSDDVKEAIRNKESLIKTEAIRIAVEHQSEHQENQEVDYERENR